MTAPIDARTLHFRHPNAEGTETDNHAVRIQFSDIAAVRAALTERQVAEGTTTSCSVQLRYLDLASTVQKPSFVIMSEDVTEIIDLMNELSIVDGVAAV